MKIVHNCFRSGILFIKLFFFVVHVQSGEPREALPKIERGVQDIIWYGENYHNMVNITNLETMTCDQEQLSCRCGKKYGYNTVVYNTDTKIVKCIKDEDIAGDIVGHDGGYLKNGKGECLGVRNQIISTTKCSKDDLSQRWLWIGIGNLLNLKALKCLQWNTSTRGFATKQCNSANNVQRWKPTNIGKTWKVALSDDSLNSRPLFNNFTTGVPKYKGCYRFSRDELMVVLKKQNCKHVFHNKNCHISLTINAPIYHTQKPICNIIWKNSMYSVFGEKWKPFSLKDPEMFTLNPVDTERTSLNMTNGERFFEQWSGTLIGLAMKCDREEHCVVLKIEGSRENKTTKSTTIAKMTVINMILSTTTAKVADTTVILNHKDNKESSVITIVIAATVSGLIVLVLVVAYFNRTRFVCSKCRKRENQDQNSELPEMLNPSNNQTNPTKSEIYVIPRAEQEYLYENTNHRISRAQSQGPEYENPERPKYESPEIHPNHQYEYPSLGATGKKDVGVKEGEYFPLRRPLFENNDDDLSGYTSLLKLNSSQG